MNQMISPEVVWYVGLALFGVISYVLFLVVDRPRPKFRRGDLVVYPVGWQGESQYDCLVINCYKVKPGESDKHQCPYWAYDCQCVTVQDGKLILDTGSVSGVNRFRAAPEGVLLPSRLKV